MEVISNFCDYYHKREEMEIYAIQFNRFYMELCIYKGEYIYYMITYGPNQFTSKGNFIFDDRGICYKTTRDEFVGFCKKNGLMIRASFNDKFDKDTYHILLDNRTAAFVDGVIEHIERSVGGPPEGCVN